LNFSNSDGSVHIKPFIILDFDSLSFLQVTSVTLTVCWFSQFLVLVLDGTSFFGGVKSIPVMRYRKRAACNSSELLEFITTVQCNEDYHLEASFVTFCSISFKCSHFHDRHFLNLSTSHYYWIRSGRQYRVILFGVLGPLK
jgi:hypothetical protein